MKYEYTIIEQVMSWNENQVTETFRTGKSVYLLSRGTEILRSAVYVF